MRRNLLTLQYSLLSNVIYFLYHSRKFIYKIFNYIYYKLSYNNIQLITYNNNKIVKTSLKHYNTSDPLSLVRTKINNEVLYNRIIFASGIETDFNKVTKSKHNIISATIKFNSVEYDFDIKAFSVVNNIILDRLFVCWYLKYKYNITCNDNYVINLIDNDIKTYTIYDNSYIILTEDSFLIKTI
jgi:hypothetical protein